MNPNPCACDTRLEFVHNTGTLRKVFLVDIYPVKGIDVDLLHGAYHHFNPVLKVFTSKNNLRLTFDNAQSAWNARNFFENSTVNGILLRANFHEHVKGFDTVEALRKLQLPPIKLEPGGPGSSEVSTIPRVLL